MASVLVCSFSGANRLIHCGQRLVEAVFPVHWSFKLTEMSQWTQLMPVTLNPS